MRSLRRAAGMTLIEVILAAALLAVFFTVVFSIVFTTLRTREAIEEAGIPWATGPVVMDRIVQDLTFASVEPYDPAKDVFKGEGESDDDVRLDFVAAVPSRERIEIEDELVRAYVNEIGYRLRRSETDRDLFALYRREDFGVDSDPAEGGKYYKLCDRVRRFTIEYFEEDPGEPGGDSAEGRTDWDQRKETKLPWGCRVTLVLAPPEGIGGEDDDDDRRADQVFVTYVPFRTRFDKAEGAGAQRPGGG